MQASSKHLTQQGRQLQQPDQHLWPPKQQLGRQQSGMQALQACKTTFKYRAAMSFQMLTMSVG
jgi:hypothetical protein